MKLVLMPSNKKQIENLKVDGIIVGLEGLCINMPTTFTMDEIESMTNSQTKEVFVALNKNIHSKDVPLLKESMIRLDKLKIKGILFYDIAVVQIKKEENLKTDLVWSQEHLTTNSVTSNFWYQEGAEYTYVSNEITLEEIEEFKKSSQAKLMVTGFGYLPMFASHRQLVTNYLKTFQLEDSSNSHYIFKEDKKYPIIETKEGTVAYSNTALNAIEEVEVLRKLDVEYLVLNSFMIKEDNMEEIVTMFATVTDNTKQQYCAKIDNMLKTDRGFLYKETIYKVKKNGC